jgi:CheY-like chemotaxis protein
MYRFVTQKGALMARVLLASDDAMVSSRVGARQTLEAAGHIVYEAHDGPGALAQLESSAPDLLVLDLMAPLIWIRGRMSKEALASSFGLTKSIKANGLAHEG